MGTLGWSCTWGINMQQPPPRDPRPIANAGQWVDQQVARLVPSWSWRAALYGAALFVLLAAICGRFGAGAQNGLTNAPAATQTTPAPPTATPANVVNGPYLGGTQDAFDAAFPRPASGYVVHVDRFVIEIYLQYVGGLDDRGRVRDILISPPYDPGQPNPKWDEAAVEMITAVFFPPDAKYLGARNDSRYDLYRVYHSELLAASLSAGIFRNIEGSPNPPGTFGWYCFGASLPGGFYQCDVSTQAPSLAST